jgi:hypothetical protein
MDHLFNWLFSMTNIENVSTLPKTPVAGAIDATQLDVQPSRVEQAGHLVPGFTQSAPEPEPQPSRDNHSWATPAQHARGPPFPAFPETWDESGWRLPPPKDLIDEQARSDMRDLFDGPERDYFSTPAFSLPQMKLYLELYFLCVDPGHRSRQKLCAPLPHHPPPLPRVPAPAARPPPHDALHRHGVRGRPCRFPHRDEDPQAASQPRLRRACPPERADPRWPKRSPAPLRTPS